MSVMDAFRTLALSYFNILSTTGLALLLLLLEKLVESDFECPGDAMMSFGYSLFFIVVPCLILLFLGWKFSDLPCASCGSCWSGCRSCYTFIRISTAPMLWFLIVLSDGRYLECLAKFLRRGEGNAIVKPIGQVVGLLGICVLIALRLFLSSCNCCRCAQDTRANWHEQKYEEYLLREVEDGIRKKANKIHEAYVEVLVEKAFSGGNCQTGIKGWMKNLETLVSKAKKNAKKEIRKKKKKAKKCAQKSNQMFAEEFTVSLNAALLENSDINV
ncbi:uncharacterized protein LOC120944781 [Rana temporaria]|uniref:uncharacterized protein LOC120944781 n=1 Tax=Rana temporaria TaxID=8407 RepID=UPI001AACF875|nr:uncharacterized protein LOC120944781 [Rana temporaria]